jgi:cell division transport system ATP-binding protein
VQNLADAWQSQAPQGITARRHLCPVIMIRLDSVSLSCCGATEPGARHAVLRDISFAVPEGGFRWLIGPSGAGKTSLLRLLSLAARPTEGRVSVLGTRLDTVRRRELPALRRRLGMVFQDFRLLPHLSAFENVALPLRLANRPEGAVRADVTDMLNWVGLGARADDLPSALSGGEQQRAAVARAVITRPALLLADEPTGNLDEAQADRLMQLLRELNRLGTTVLIATHSRALVDRHPAPAVHLRDGMLVSAND